MDRRIVPFKHWHLDWVRGHGNPVGGFGPKMPEEAYRVLEQQNSWSAVVDGDILACAGTLQQWPGRHTAWAFLNLQTGPYMLWITRETLKALDGVHGRIEVTVRKDFEQGHNWARLLGFQVETPRLKAYGPEGEDHVGYVRFNG